MDLFRSEVLLLIGTYTSESVGEESQLIYSSDAQIA